MLQTAPHPAETVRAVDALRIGFVADDLYPGFGGQAKATEGHIEMLICRGHVVYVLAGAEADPTDPPEGVVVRRLPAWQPGETQTGFAWPSPGAIRWLVDHVDVVHINTPTPLALAVGLAARAKKIPCVMGVHTQLESSALHFERARTVVESSVAAWFRTLYAVPTALVAPTPFAARTARRFTAKPIHVVSNGVRLPSDVPSRQEARSLLPVDIRPPPGERVLVYVGRLATEKRPQDLFPLLERLGRDVRLWVAGRGPLTEALEREAEERGLIDRVRFLGFVSESRKRLLLAAADLFVMPSPTELQSIATLEAMASGRAVVAADHPTSAVPEAIREADAGLVYAPGDLDGTAAAIRSLLDDAPRLHAYERAARDWAERHSVDHSARALETVYLDLIA